MMERYPAIERLVDWCTQADPPQLASYVGQLRRQNPGIGDDALAHKIVRRKAHKNGLVGAITGVPGWTLLPVTMPADMLASSKLQINMAMCVAFAYGHTHRSIDLKTDVSLILAGDAGKEVLKRFGIEAGTILTRRAINKYITREVMQVIWRVLSRKIITKAGEKSLTSFMKLVPLAGAPIGYVANWSAARLVGQQAIHYYSGRG